MLIELPIIVQQTREYARLYDAAGQYLATTKVELADGLKAHFEAISKNAKGTDSRRNDANSTTR